MAIDQALDDLVILDRLAQRSLPAQRFNPLAKLIVTGAFIIAVASFPKYELFRVMALGAYPIIMFLLLRIPARIILRYLLIAAPFALLLGAFNPFWDRQVVTRWGSLVITGGWLSFLSLVTRLLLTVSAALILVAGTGFPALCRALNQLRMPKLLVAQFLLLYRFLFLIPETARRMYRAYLLRAPKAQGMPLCIWGSLLSHLLLRAYDRGVRLYRAMLSRRFDGTMPTQQITNWQGRDIGFLLLNLLFLGMVRFAHSPEVLGRIVLQLIGR